MVVLGIAYASLTRGRAESIASPSPSGTGASSAPSASLVSEKGACAGTTDPCRCAADRGAELLIGSFPERALQAVSHAPSSCDSTLMLGVKAEALAAVERGADATMLAASVLVREPQNRFARRAQGIVAIHAKEFAAADEMLAKLVQEDTNDADSTFYLALSQRRRDRYNGAREGFLRVLKLNPRHIDARYNLVTLTAAAGAAQEAEHDYQELLQIAPVGDARLVAARAALNKSDQGALTELPTLHRGASAAPGGSVAPAR